MDKYARILVVDDDESVRDTTKAILESEGFLVDYAVSGRKLSEKMKRQLTTWRFWILDYQTWKGWNC